VRVCCRASRRASFSNGRRPHKVPVGICATTCSTATLKHAIMRVRCDARTDENVVVTGDDFLVRVVSTSESDLGAQSIERRALVFARGRGVSSAFRHRAVS
jgi:hypothetical protein